MRKLILLTAGVLTLAYGVTGEEQAVKEAKEARKLYVGKCARCHPLYNAGSYSQESWDDWLRKMIPKAKLKPEEVDLLSRHRQSLGTGRR